MGKVRHKSTHEQPPEDIKQGCCPPATMLRSWPVSRGEKSPLPPEAERRCEDDAPAGAARQPAAEGRQGSARAVAGPAVPTPLPTSLCITQAAAADQPLAHQPSTCIRPPQSQRTRHSAPVGGCEWVAAALPPNGPHLARLGGPAAEGKQRVVAKEGEKEKVLLHAATAIPLSPQPKTTPLLNTKSRGSPPTAAYPLPNTALPPSCKPHLASPAALGDREPPPPPP